MTTRTRIALALGVLTATVTPTIAQPADPPKVPVKDPFAVPEFTAFPAIKVPLTDRGLLDQGKLFAPVAAGFPRTPAADAPPLVKLRTAQVNAGMAYLQRVFQVIVSGRWAPNEFETFLKTSADVYRVAAELEVTAAGKQKCLEDRVLVFKAFEWFTKARVDAGTDPRQRLDLARFARLQAEAELLQLVEAQKADKPK